TAFFETLNYRVWTETILSRDFGVPQTRPRFILVAQLKRKHRKATPFQVLENIQKTFLSQRKLKIPVAANQALGDLRTKGRPLSDCVDAPGRKQGPYRPPRSFY